ncbi:hypothetical protein ASPSYDRAFT_38580 [Aspergillus sydowii CBS 593.65]|uniref:Uncharacterized protein n=1 Tax=Aspergillus sydowii CBS 593.65 TaxID=1036612 RepID=A0A1L9TWZ3_9EURO|nr:uncharacterized protein ASPSYDRAFT_38580 [Aspergillus sydowii CBS 593.65]OJJ63912.1 hypothetical protein ASPSYDRAFT_38580 [Aspergillus sydowii CBS 593.65]
MTDIFYPGGHSILSRPANASVLTGTPHDVLAHKTDVSSHISAIQTTGCKHGDLYTLQWYCAHEQRGATDILTQRWGIQASTICGWPNANSTHQAIPVRSHFNAVKIWILQPEITWPSFCRPIRFSEESSLLQVGNLGHPCKLVLAPWGI